eukprot:6214417-Pleurochrysis_carterae.AAC.1
MDMPAELMRWCNREGARSMWSSGWTGTPSSNWPACVFTGCFLEATKLVCLVSAREQGRAERAARQLQVLVQALQLVKRRDVRGTVGAV